MPGKGTEVAGHITADVLRPAVSVPRFLSAFSVPRFLSRKLRPAVSVGGGPARSYSLTSR